MNGVCMWHLLLELLLFGAMVTPDDNLSKKRLKFRRLKKIIVMFGILMWLAIGVIILTFIVKQYV